MQRDSGSALCLVLPRICGALFLVLPTIFTFFYLYFSFSIHWRESFALENEKLFLILFLCMLKVEAVTKRILWIKSTTPEAKVLVFSSWNDVLDVLQHAFTANNINFIRMQGGR